jgi:nicotinamide mononucleotide transporter
MSAAEWFTVATGLLYVVAIIRRRRIGWIFGGISALVLAVLAARSRLPMQALLQLSYVVASVYGWRSWSGEASQPVIRVWHWRGHLLLLGGCGLASLALAPLLAGESAFPMLDSLVACVALGATWLTARVYLENWLYWIAVDAVSLFLFSAQQLNGVAVLYGLYTGIAAVGLYTWWKGWRAARGRG